MKTAYFDCFSGISGDMIIGALLDLGLELNFLEKNLSKIKLQNYKIGAKKIVKNGITATKFATVETGKMQHHEERNLKDINKIIDNSELENEIKNKIKRIFSIIANAESKVHGKPIDKIHFHELGSMDTIIDVAGAVIGFWKLGIEKIYCSKINTGMGFVEFSHGKFPVPAPATAQILKEIPIYHDNTESELTTPTGAAIIKEFASGFGEMPPMKISKIGYGAGMKELTQPNVLRVFIGDLTENHEETITIIETNIDNMNPELYPYVMSRLLDSGALDVYLTNIIMKKARPGIKMTVLLETKDTDRMSKIIFDETTTLGIRIFRAERKILRREIKKVKTKFGIVRFKESKSGNELKNSTPEFDDCAKIAGKLKIPLKRVYRDMIKR